MKKQISILFLGFFLMLSTISIEATPGRLKDESITNCNGIYYGYHGKDNHWHVAKQNKDGSYAAIGDILVNGNPCNPSDNIPVSNPEKPKNDKNNSGNNQMKTGWVKTGNDWQYYNSKGQMQTGWQKLNNNWFYLNEVGTMQTGWTKIKGSWYLMNNSGHMQKGWQKLNGNWYYLNSSGVMQTKSQKINNKMYSFDSSGKMK